MMSTMTDVDGPMTVIGHLTSDDGHSPSIVEILNSEFDKAKQKLAEAEPIIEKFKNLKKEVARHIFDSMKVNILIKEGNLSEADKIMKNIKNIDDKMYLSALNEFKASIWSHCNYCPSTVNIAIEFAKIAVKEDPNAAIAHHLWGRNLRTLRRFVSTYNRPEKDEIYHIVRAFELNKNPQFGLYVAQIFKENKQFDEAMKIFNQLDEYDIKETLIQLRLALAFLQAGELEKAKKYLDFVEEHSAEESMFLHYKGLYLMKKNNYEEAAEYLLKAGEKLNYVADQTYIDCMRKKLGFKFDITAHLLRMLEKYSDFERSWKKEILLNIAFCYFYENNLEESMKYFQLGLKIQNEELSLKKFWVKFTNKAENVLNFLTWNLLPKIQRERSRFSDEIISEAEKLQTLISNN